MLKGIIPISPAHHSEHSSSGQPCIRGPKGLAGTDPPQKGGRSSLTSHTQPYCSPCLNYQGYSHSEALTEIEPFGGAHRDRSRSEALTET